MAELTERGSQWLIAMVERTRLADSRELHAASVERRIDPSALGGRASMDAWLDRHRAGTISPFFAGLESRAATVQALRELVPDAEGELLDRATRMLRGEFDLLGHERLRYPLPIDWHRDPVSGTRTPLTHWSQIDFLDPAIAGDHKFVWEINRHHILVSLGQAYWYTGDERWSERLLSWLDEWMDANPPKLGINWASSLEVAFRSISWIWALQLVRGSPHLTTARFARAVGFLALFGRHIERFLSTYFSPNTHLTGEALGLYVLGTQLSPLRDARRWRDRGLRILLEQLPRHVRADGVYFEQATYYQRYTLDFYLHLMILAERCGDRLDHRVAPTVVRLLECLRTIARPDGSIPLIGDDDGGRLLPLDGRRGEQLHSALATGAVLFDDPSFAYCATRPNPELVWLFGPDGADRWRRLRPLAPREGSRAFLAGGLHVMRDGWSSTAGVMTIDCGPHGVFNCGHAHADALAFDLTVDGIPVLIDPGTFTYTTSRAWRDYFRSTAAHNTVSLGDESSSTPAGPFSWRSTATSSLERWHASDVVDYFAGTHDGYERAGIDAGVCRQLLFIKSGYWIVRDTVRSEHDVGASASFQAAAGLTIRQDGLRSLAVACGHDVLRIDVLDEGSAISIENAWVSHAYGAKSEAPRLCVRFGAAAGGELHTVLSAARLAARVRRTRTMERDIIEVLHGEVVDRVVFAESEGRAPIDGVETDADIVFLRRTNETDEPREVFVSGATRLIVDDVTIATSPVPSAFAAAYDPDSGSWRRRDVGVIASVVEHGVSSGKIEREAPASDRVPTPSVEVPYYSG
ncbi:MAG: hypothetical protein MNPFHGCM_02056 [Gemmatimonadaceae bacterium]|nr:hypothetical protein [Gemmatimonadaceae bacterium]